MPVLKKKPDAYTGCLLGARVFLALTLLGSAGLHRGALGAATDEVVTLDTRPGVMQPFLLLQPAPTPKGVVVLFPADEGEVNFRETLDGYEVDNRGGGLTARKAMREALRRRGFAVALIAPPSDRRQLDASFRKSAEHAQDLHEVIAYLRQRYQGKVYLHGHCLGSLSAASVATRLKNEGISGVILSSTRLSGPAGAVTDFQRGAIAVPVLLVQHKEDSCPFSLYDAVERAKAFYQGAAPKVDLITVTGGEGKVTIKMRCKNGFHGFRGAERDTAEAIATWLLGKEFPSQVDAGRR